MNALRGIAYLSLRGYRTNRGSTSVRRPKPQRQVENIEPEFKGSDLLADEFEDPEDLDAYASDFYNVGQFDKMHDREMEFEKDKLKSQIVKRKYFKLDEPNMLTWDEKEQIRVLYKEDPEEWTPERLSDSFPASKGAILKILRSKWSVKSVKTVERYQKTVKENWDLFKAGKLKVSPELEAHLAKFKNRQIRPIDRNIIVEKILKPKPVFPEPRSTVFSDIIRSYKEENPDSDDEREDETTNTKATKSKSFSWISSNEVAANSESKALSVPTKLATDRKFSGRKSVTFDQFLQNHVEGVRDERMTPVDRVLVDELKRQSTEAYKTESLVFQSESAIDAWKEDKANENAIAPRSTASESESARAAETSFEKTKKELAVPDTQTESTANLELASVLEGSLETGIIERQKTDFAQLDDYPEFIKIPHKKYKPGVTYRVQDRYYDDDGEFLYRVPGLKT